MSHHLRSTCRVCDGTDLVRFLELGPQPLANAFLSAGNGRAAEPMFPLDVYFCRTCSLVQLLDVVDADTLFRHYLYVSGTSEAMRAHFDAYAETVVRARGLASDALVVEAASNDGTLLRAFRDRGSRVVGVEPATNIAAMANEAGIPTVAEFFTPEVADRVMAEHGPADVVVANNVLAHVDDSVEFLTAAARMLKPDGIVTIEAPYVGDMLDGLEWDTIYHEHLCYFSITALDHLFRRSGLTVYRVDRTPVHGGSVHVWAMRSDAAPDRSALEPMLAAEVAAGVTTEDRFHRFARDVAENRRAIVDLLTRLRESGHHVGAYAAPAKGNTLLNYCGIGPDVIEFTVDRSPLKVGLLTPGMHIPVLPAESLVERQPDYAVILAWNFADEILRQQATYLERGGKFIIPIPTPHVIEASA